VHKPTPRESKPDLEVINPASARYVPQVQEAFDAKAAELLQVERAVPAEIFTTDMKRELKRGPAQGQGSERG
jgi:hypothetical protein